MPVKRGGSWRWFGLTLLPFIYSQALWFLQGQSFSLVQSLFSYGVGAAALAAFWVLQPASRSFYKKAARLVALFTLLSGLAVGIAQRQTIAWGLLLAGVAALCFALVQSAARSGWPRLLAAVFCAAGLALLVIGASQLIEGFAEEEFFSGVQFVFLAGWLLLIWLTGRLKLSPAANESNSMVLPGWLPALLLAGLIVFSGVLFRQYQRSFYPLTAPTFTGIDSENPLLCGSLAETNAKTYQGEAVYQRLMQRLAANDPKTTPELGMLALLTGDEVWRQDFREALLKEAREAKFSGPANSVKYGQYETAIRLYYYVKIQQQEPLFSPEEDLTVRTWMAAVNRRALTVEWVDWMYAAAFSEWPRGPYLNQEIGVGLISLLEATGYRDPELALQNQAFLAVHPEGWEKGFRNTDDSLWYQTVWLNNAVYQSMKKPELGNQPVIQQRQLQGFEWLLAQARPDGSVFGYNPLEFSPASVAYLGAEMQADDRLLWLAGAALDYLDQHGGRISPQVGISGPLNLTGKVPQMGSCLLYGNSGLPNQSGPLAPDKIVMRSGWQPDSSYLLLNLRFTGWHRYKASNSIVSIYRQEAWVVENTTGSALSWLPVGRAAFRDKRIPRENLNGLVIEKSGISQLIYWVTGFGSRWAQDVPVYAQVERFSPDGAVIESVTSLTNWNGWDQRRKIAFVPDGPIAIFDQADGPQDKNAGITWQVKVPAGSFEQNHIQNGERLAVGESSSGELVMLFENGHVTVARSSRDETLRTLLYQPDTLGQVSLVTVFLPESWAGADVQYISGKQPALLIRLNGQEISLSAE